MRDRKKNTESALLRMMIGVASAETLVVMVGRCREWVTAPMYVSSQHRRRDVSVHLLRGSSSHGRVARCRTVLCADAFVARNPIVVFHPLVAYFLHLCARAIFGPIRETDFGMILLRFKKWLM